MTRLLEKLYRAYFKRTFKGQLAVRERPSPSGWRSRLIVLTPLLVVLGSNGCTHVAVTKVPAGPDSDKIKGFRYYLPRPFLAVKTEFLVESSDNYIPGTVSGDGQYLNLDPTQLDKLKLSVGPQVPASAITLAPPTESVPPSGLQGLQGGKKGAGSGGGGSGGSGTDKGGSGTSASGRGSNQGAGSSGGASDGSGSGKQSDGGATASAKGGSSNGGLVSLTGPFDVVYLPDFDEQYAVDLSAGAGTADVSLQVTNGWMLEGIAVKTDNTAITKAIADTISSLIGLVSPASAAGKAAGAVSAAAAPAPSGLQGLTGQQVLVRVRRLRHVVPGLYPIYKPKELKERFERVYSEGQESQKEQQKPGDEQRKPGNEQQKPKKGPLLGSKNATASPCYAPCDESWMYTSPFWGDFVEFHTRVEVTLDVVRASSGSPAAAGGQAHGGGAAPIGAIQALLDEKPDLRLTVVSAIPAADEKTLVVTVVAKDAKSPSDSALKAAKQRLTQRLGDLSTAAFTPLAIDVKPQ